MFYIVYMKNILIENLKNWLSKRGNSYAKAAVFLGYRDSAPIRQWIARNSIPSYQQDRVILMIKGESK